MGFPRFSSVINAKFFHKVHITLLFSSNHSKLNSILKNYLKLFLQLQKQTAIRKTFIIHFLYYNTLCLGITYKGVISKIFLRNYITYISVLKHQKVLFNVD